MDQQSPIAPPRGFRDILPTEARELGVIEQTLAEVFADSGFTPLHPPLLEYGAADSAKRRRMQFLDSDGSLVALRPGDIAGALRRAGEAGMSPDELQRAAHALTGEGGSDGAEAGELCRVIELAASAGQGAWSAGVSRTSHWCPRFRTTPGSSS